MLRPAKPATKLRMRKRRNFHPKILLRAHIEHEAQFVGQPFSMSGACFIFFEKLKSTDLYDRLSTVPVVQRVTKIPDIFYFSITQSDFVRSN